MKIALSAKGIIQAGIDAGLVEWQSTQHVTSVVQAIEAGVRAALALDAKQPEPEPAKTPNRAGQWFRDRSDPEKIYGPIVRSIGKRHELKVPDQWLSEDSIINGRVVRIPPKLDGMDADECREPVGDDVWYSADSGILFEGTGDLITDPIYGLNRWIYKPAAKLWPTGPFKSALGDMVREVRGTNGRAVCASTSKTNAEAIALALTEFWHLVAWMRKHAGKPLHLTELEEFFTDRDAILARIDKAGFQMPKV